MRRLVSRPKISPRSVALLVAHAFIFVTAYLLAVLLRFDASVPPEELHVLAKLLPVILAVKLLCFWYFGAFRGLWRYLTFADLADLLKAATVSSLIIASVDYLGSEVFGASRGVLILDYAATILILGGSRASFRLIQEHVWTPKAARDARRALIVGANRAGEMIARQTNGNGHARYRIVGYLDDNHACHGARLGGIPVLGSPDDATVLAERVGAEAVLVAADTMAGARVRQLMHECSDLNISVKIVPSVEDILSGRYKFKARDVRIDDLLRRDPVELDSESISDLLQGRRVMVTGAGGSIGSEICRQVAKFAPETLILVERFESGLFFIHRELQQLDSSLHTVPRIADILDRRRMKALFEEWKPDVVFHAAAHKHVPMMEDNRREAVKNNVLGTKCVASLARQYGTERFVLISTDKAVNPTSIMGATKQLAERYIHSLKSTQGTRFMAVRFGNVLGSIGSVVPLFQEQIRRGGPVTVTHPEMRRYFMTIPEASQLVLQAAAMGNGGEIFLLDMGEPVRIVDLARDLIRLSGFTLDDIPIEYTGMRPGEKLYEELRFDEESLLETPHPKLHLVYHRPYNHHDVDWIRALRDVLESEDLLWEKIKELVPELAPPAATAANADAVLIGDVATAVNWDPERSDGGVDRVSRR